MASLRRSPAAAAASVLVACAIGATVHAATLSPTDAPLPGSTFQGGDGDQTAGGPGLVDWAELETQSRVTAVPDPSGADDAFAGGTKDGSPGDWSFKTVPGGVTPGGTNVLDAYVSVDQLNGQMFLYLAATRASDTGTSYVSFELNRDARLWDNGRANIPCRRTGDLSITYQPHGSVQDVIAQRWVTATADAATGCARTGSFADVTLRPNVDVQGAFNATAITSALPGALTTIPTRQFSENAINLTALLAAEGGACNAFTSVWISSHSSTSPSSNMSDIVWPRPLEVRTCAAAGTKFLDVNADGIRDAGEPGLEGFRIFADYDDDGVLDDDEPFAYTDAQGNYVIDGIERTTYTLRETTPTGGNAAGWRCSFPNASTTVPAGATTTAPGGPFACGWRVDRTVEPFARDRDFGNWRPAHLTLVKQVFPEGDDTHFTFVHPGRPEPVEVTDGSVVGGAIELRPGTYTAGEVAHPDFMTHVTCEQDGEIVVDADAGTAEVTLGAGDDATCRFYNTRNGTPGIALVKEGPESVTAGQTIHYTLRVTNVGTVAIAASDVRVADPGCSEPRRTTGDDTLEPDETWTYTCTRETDPPDDACVGHVVRNTATVTAGDDVSDSSSAVVAVRCPQPAIALRKVGPQTAPAGSVARFAFFVFNIGDTSFSAGGATARTAGVSVADGQCDAAPVVGRKLDAAQDPDPSPETFDPGDIWVFTCLSTTPSVAPDGTCKDFISTNTAHAQAVTDPLSATARDSFDTTLTCTPPPAPPPTPPRPPAPEPVLPLPDLPVAADPEGPSLLEAASALVPSAGVSGTAGVRVPSLRRCLRRGSVVVVRVQRAASVRLSLGGRPLRGVQVRPLADRIVIRITRAVPPGRHRIDAVVRFQRGADTATVRLSRAIRGCAAARRSPAPPPVTG
jgi:hypothetical protein